MPTDVTENTLETFLLNNIIGSMKTLVLACNNGDAREEVLTDKIERLLEANRHVPALPVKEAKRAKAQRLEREKFLKALLRVIKVSYPEKADVE